MEQPVKTYRIVYPEKKHKSDRTLTVWSTSPAQALEKYENSKHALNRKPLQGSEPNIYTEKEFAQLEPYYIMYEENDKIQFCYILAQNTDSARAKFNRRFSVKPLEVLNTKEFKIAWQRIQEAKQTNMVLANTRPVSTAA